MSALGSLIVKLSLEHAEYTSGLNKTEQAALASAKKVQDTFDSMQGKVVATAGAIAGGLAAAFTVTALKSLIRSTAESNAALGDLALTAGTTAEALSGLSAVGKFTGATAEIIATAMNKLTHGLASATEDSLGVSKAVRAIGLDFGEFQRLKPEEQMQRVAQSLAKFEDGASKAAVMTALYGEAGAKLLPFMNDLAVAGDLQAKVTTEQSAASDSLGRSLMRLEASGEGWKKELVNGMIPALDVGAKALVDIMSGAGGLRDEVKKLSADGSIKQWTKDAITGLTYVAEAGEYAWRTLKSIGKGMGGLAAALVQALSGDFKGAWATLVVSGQDMIDAFSGPTLGSRLRDRMADIDAMGKTAEAAKPKLDYHNVLAKTGKAATEAKNPVDALMESIEKRAAHIGLELLGQEKLTEAEKFAIDILEQLRSGKVKVTEAESALIGERLRSMLEQEKSIKLQEEEKQAIELARTERMKVVQAMEQAAGKLIEQNEELEREIELIGLTQEQQRDVLRARADAIILTKESTLAEIERRDAITGTMTREQIALAAEIDGLKRRNDLLGKKQVRESEFAAWQAMWQSIDQTAHDVFVNVFEDGAGTFKRLGQTLKAAVLDMLYQMTIKRWIISIGASVTGVGAAAAAGAGGGGAMSTLGNAGGILSGASAMGGAVAAGAGWVTGATTFGGALSAGGSLVAAGGAGVLPGMGMIAGALAPIGVGLAGLYSLYKSLDKSGTPHLGAASEYSAGVLQGGEAVWKRQGTSGRYSAAAQASVDAIAKGVGDTLDGVAHAFGKKGGYAVMTGYSDDSSDDPGFGSFRIAQDGKKVKDWEDGRTSKWAPKIFADGEEGWKMYLTAIAKDTKQVLLDMDLPSWARTMLSQIDDAAGMEGLSNVLAQITQAQTLFQGLADTLVGFAGIADTTQEALLKAAGGADALAQSTNGYYQNFYSEEERQGIAKRQLGAQLSGLGLEGFDFDAADARTTYRSAVEAALAQADAATGEAKAKAAETAAALLGLSGALAGVTAASEDAANGVAQTFQDMTRLVKGVLDNALKNAASAAEAQQMAAQDFAAGIYDTLLGSVSAGLSDMISQSLVAPMMNSLLAGATASSTAMAAGGATAATALATGGAYAGQANAEGGATAANALVAGGAAAGSIVGGVVEQAQAYIASFRDVLSNQDVQAGIRDISALMGSFAGDLYGLKASIGASSYKSSAYAPSSVTNEADSLAQALKHLGETVSEEIKRLAGLMNGADPQRERAALLAEFAIQSAKAKTGDQAALGELTGLSRAIEDATKLTAASALDLNATRGWLASSMESTLKSLKLDLPKFDVGTNYVPRTMAAIIHEGEAIVPKAFNPWAGGGASSSGAGNAELAAELRALREDNRQQAGEIARLNLRMARILERWDGGGMPAERTETV